jgi:hypothetical protein
MALANGSYQIHLGVTANDLKTRLAKIRPLSFYVSAARLFQGVVDLGAEFQVVRHDAELRSAVS